MTQAEMRKKVLESMRTMGWKQERDIKVNTKEVPEENELCIADFPTAQLMLCGTEDGKFWIRRNIGFTDSAAEWSTPISFEHDDLKDLETAIAVFKGCLMMEREYVITRDMSAVHPDDGKFEKLARLEAEEKLRLA